MDGTEQKILRQIDHNRDRIIAFAEDIAAHPEPGFEEKRTAEKTAELLRKLGYEVQTGLALTGVRGDWGSEKGPNLTVIGRWTLLDAGRTPWRIRLTELLMPVGIMPRWRL